MKDKYIYHRVKEKTLGTKLMPLNELKNKYPEAYKNEVLKYKNREDLLKRQVPNLNCLWNDVLHFAPLDPKIIFDKLKKIGFDYKMPKYYKVPVSLLRKLEVVYYKYPQRVA